MGRAFKNTLSLQYGLVGSATVNSASVSGFKSDRRIWYQGAAVGECLNQAIAQNPFAEVDERN
jgi:hypothetical protein